MNLLTDLRVLLREQADGGLVGPIAELEPDDRELYSSIPFQAPFDELMYRDSGSKAAPSPRETLFVSVPFSLDDQLLLFDGFDFSPLQAIRIDSDFAGANDFDGLMTLDPFDHRAGVRVGDTPFIEPGRYLDTILMHEMLHILGFLSRADVVPDRDNDGFDDCNTSDLGPISILECDNFVDLLDVFRFAEFDLPFLDGPDARQAVRFVGTLETAGPTNTVEVSLTRLQGTTQNGGAFQRQQATVYDSITGAADIQPAHFRQAGSQTQTGVPGQALGIMDPFASNLLLVSGEGVPQDCGAYEYLPYVTRNDLYILDSIGWNIDPDNDLPGIPTARPVLTSPMNGDLIERDLVYTIAGSANVRKLSIFDDPIATPDTLVLRDDVPGTGGMQTIDSDLIRGESYTIYVAEENLAGIRSSLPISVTVRCPGDVNGDGQVNESDYFAWVTEFVSADPDPRADVNEDGELDESDYFAWVTAFLNGC